MTGRLAVCAGSCGPGNLHLINGLFECHRNRVPVLAIAAQIPSPEIGGGYFQETHPEILFRECSHYCELISQPTQLPRVLEIAHAHRYREGRRCGHRPARRRRPATGPRPTSRPHGRRARADRAAAGERDRPARAACSTARSGSRSSAAPAAPARTIRCSRSPRRSRRPIVHALRGKEYIEHDNPFDVGMTGLIGFSSGYHAMLDCDMLLMLGTDFPYRQFYPDRRRRSRRSICAASSSAAARRSISASSATSPARSPRCCRSSREDRPRFPRRRAGALREARKGLDELAVGEPGRKPIHPQYLAKVIDEVAADDAIFTCDVGTPTVWAARYLHVNGRRRLLGSFMHGSMANALPQAIGAQARIPAGRSFPCPATAASPC